MTAPDEKRLIAMALREVASIWQQSFTTTECAAVLRTRAAELEREAEAAGQQPAKDPIGGWFRPTKWDGGNGLGDPRVWLADGKLHDGRLVLSKEKVDLLRKLITDL